MAAFFQRVILGFLKRAIRCRSYESRAGYAVRDFKKRFMRSIRKTDGGEGGLRKRFLFCLITLALLILLIPTILVFMQSGTSQKTVSAEIRSQANPSPDKESAVDIRIYLTKEKRVEEVPLESYIRGVIASEMPAHFHPEALKAQALAARTYIVERLIKNDFSDMSRWGEAARSAIVTDTALHQVYTTDQELRKKWGSEYRKNVRKMDEAVQATEGQIITYQGKPIYAAFFSTSNGWTENSEDYFSSRYPYLRSVNSAWDKISPKYRQVQTLEVSGLLQKLEMETGKRIAMSTFSGQNMIRVLKKTPGNRIAEIQIGDQTFTGREVREALQLASSDFSWQIKGEKIQFITRGYGHGVGMSQWGANLMARQGKKVSEIIAHYYKGVKIERMNLKHLPEKN